MNNNKYMNEMDFACVVGMVLGILVTILAFAAIMDLNHASIQPKSTPSHVRNVPCKEDEVVAPKIDHNPHYGLTWTCQNAEQYIARGTQIIVQGESYDINAPDRPACFMEPSGTKEGYEVILYPHLSMHHDGDLGFEVSCPEPNKIP